MRKLLGKVGKISVAAVMMGAALQVVAPSAAQADYRDCPDRYLCLWGDGNYEGRYLMVPEGDGLFRSNIGSAMNDLTTSIWNRTGRRVCFYNDINYQGLLLCIDGGGSTPNVGSGANDRISSFQPF